MIVLHNKRQQNKTHYYVLFAELICVNPVCCITEQVEYNKTQETERYNPYILKSTRKGSENEGNGATFISKLQLHIQACLIETFIYNYYIRDYVFW